MKISIKIQKEYKKILIQQLDEIGYNVVTGKGSFKQGSCVVLKDKKVVLNNFLPIDLQLKFLSELFVNEQEKIPDEIGKFIKSIT